MAWFRSVCDQNTVILGLACSTRYRATQSYFIECVIPHNWYYFSTLKEEWRRERGATSSITKSAMCFSYQRIIGMGEKAVPFIMQDLREHRDQPDQWFWALRAITGANPVSDENRGNFPRMAEQWLEWNERRQRI